MACLEMYNNSHSHSHSHSHSQSSSTTPPPPPPMSPRISFSNDFVESHHHHSHNSHHLLKTARSSETPPPSSDFEFNITNGNILSSASADELFFKGKLLPFKDCNNNSHQMQRTLRDELLVDDEADLSFSLKPPKGSSSSSSSSNRWKGFLGLRKSHIGSKKPEKINIDSSFDSAKRFSFPIEDPNPTKSPQEMVGNEGPSSSDMEMGI